MAKEDEAKQEEMKNTPDTEPVTEPAAEEPAEGAEPAADDSARGRFLARLKGKYPDEAFDDDEAVYDRAGKDYDDYEKRLGDYAEREKAFSDLFLSNPVLARMMSSIKKNPKKDAEVYFIRRFGENLRDILDDPEKQDMVVKENKEWAERVAKSKEYEAEWRKNISKSLSALEKAGGKDMTEDDKNNAIDWLDGITNNVVKGVYTPEMVQLALHAIRHDDDVAQAKAQGLVDGRNEKIQEKLHKPAKGDGMPSLGGRSGGLPKQEPTVPGALGNYGSERQDIWSRGGEKRRRMNG